MAKRYILTTEKDLNALREVSKPVTVFDEKLWQLLDDMADTMRAANGLGLAAPQVGVLKRAFIVSSVDEKHIYEFINPVIKSQSGSHVSSEGCLSIPKISGYVARPKKVIVEAQNRFGEWFEFRSTELLICAAISHEHDHLEGILYSDKIIEGYKPKKAK